MFWIKHAFFGFSPQSCVLFGRRWFAHRTGLPQCVCDVFLWDAWCVCYNWWLADVLLCVPPVREDEEQEEEDIPRDDYRTYGDTVFSYSDIKHL